MTRFILERYTESIKVDDIAASAGLSIAVARRLFKRYMGMGVHQFVRRMRLATRTGCWPKMRLAFCRYPWRSGLAL